MDAVCLQVSSFSYWLEEIMNVLAVTTVYPHYDFEFNKYEATSNWGLYIVYQHVLFVKCNV